MVTSMWYVLRVIGDCQGDLSQVRAAFETLCMSLVGFLKARFGQYFMIVLLFEMDGHNRKQESLS